MNAHQSKDSSWPRRFIARVQDWLGGWQGSVAYRNPKLLAEVMTWFEAELARAAGLSDEQRRLYLGTAERVLQRMTVTAITRVRQHVESIRFYASVEELTVDVARDNPNLRVRIMQGRFIAGSYVRDAKLLRLNGGFDLDGERTVPDATYAHEFTHAIDGSIREISSNPAWRDAWEREILRGELSDRARISPSEGFADFGSIMYTGISTRRSLAKQFPQCVAVWRGRGIW